jgi:hypothetical protein
MEAQMGFIQMFLGKKGHEHISSSDLEEFISKHVEESLNLEYKDSRILKKPEDVSRVVSSFANSDGGLLIVGVSEVKERNRRFPGEITWDNDPKHDKEWFEAAILNKVHPIVKGVRVVTVNSKDGTIFLVDIPQSQIPPHMAPDGKYYSRRNFSNMIMEHYQVADAFGKRAKPILIPRITIKEYNDEEGTFNLSIFVVNEGLILAKWPFHQLRMIGCEHIEKVGISFWERVIHQTGDDGISEEVIETESPVQVIHTGMVHPAGSHKFKFDGPLIIGKIILAAEQAETKNYAIHFTREWLKKQTEELESEEPIDLPIVGRDELDDLPKDLTDSVVHCIEAMPEDEQDQYAARFVWDVLMHPSILRSLQNRSQEKSTNSSSEPD